MRVFVDYRPLSGTVVNSKKTGHFTRCLLGLEAENPVLECQYMTDRSGMKRLQSILPPTRMITRQSLPGILGWKRWNEQQVPRALHKNKSELLLMTGGIASFHADLPQAVWIWREEGLGVTSSSKSYNRFFLRQLPATVDRARVLITESDWTREWLLEQFPTMADKIVVVPPAPDEAYRPFGWEEKEQVKRRFAGGKEYFMVSAGPEDAHHLLFVLKSFSRFKKRQQSNLQIVIAVMNHRKPGAWAAKLDTYKYKADLHVYRAPGDESFAAMVAGAYGLIQLSEDEQAWLNAFRAGTPVIKVAAERAGSPGEASVLYATPGDEEQLSEQLKRLYKDENLRNELLSKGLQTAAGYSRSQSTEQLRGALLRAMEIPHHQARLIGKTGPATAI